MCNMCTVPLSLSPPPQLVCARVSEVVSLLPSHPSLLSALPSVLQHATSTSGELPPELQTVQSELRPPGDRLRTDRRPGKASAVSGILSAEGRRTRFGPGTNSRVTGDE